jgi:hypothetical protein
MAARGYGAGTPTRRPRLPWNAVDRATMGVGVVTCLVATASIAGRLGRYRFYPTMDRLGEGWALVVAAGTTVVGLILAGRIRR